jgi:hypothetical protein
MKKILTILLTIITITVSGQVVYFQNGNLYYYKTGTWTKLDTTVARLVGINLTQLKSDTTLYDATKKQLIDSVLALHSRTALVQNIKHQDTARWAANGDSSKLKSIYQAHLDTLRLPKLAARDTTGTIPKVVTNLGLRTGIPGGKKIVGGTGVNDSVTIIGTSGNGTLTKPAVTIHGGNNGATPIATFLNNGNVGIGIVSPSCKFAVGSDLGTIAIPTLVSISNTTGNSGFIVGQSATNCLVSKWIYNSIPSSSYGIFNTASYSNDLRFDAKNILFQTSTSGNIGIGTLTPTYKLSFSGDSYQIIWMENNTTSNTAGKYLHIQAGGCTSDATDKDGGELRNSSGIARGTGSSFLSFYTATPGATGNGLRTPTEKVRLSGSGCLSIGTTTNYKYGLYLNRTFAANKDSIPITTGKTWGLVPDTTTGQIKRQLISSTAYTASNGITLNSLNFELGGSLTKSTNIFIGSNHFGLFDVWGGFVLNKGNFRLYTSDLNEERQTEINGDTLAITFSGKAIINTAEAKFDSLGFKYINNLSAKNASNPRWMPDKNYVDSMANHTTKDVYSDMPGWDMIISSTYDSIIRTNTKQWIITLVDSGIYQINYSGYSNCVDATWVNYAETDVYISSSFNGTLLQSYFGIMKPAMSGNTQHLGTVSGSFLYNNRKNDILSWHIHSSDIPSTGVEYFLPLSFYAVKIK